MLAGETLSAKTPTHELIDARLQLAPYSDGGIPLAVTAVASPTGARLAGKHGVGLLPIGATLVVEDFDALAFPQMTIPGDQVDEMITIINDAGAGVIGTPEQARAQVQRLWDQSGGFGCMLQMGQEWANPAATKRSAKLFAAEVIPHFQGQAQPTLDAAARASEVRDDLAQTQLQAIDHMTKKYQEEVDSK